MEHAERAAGDEQIAHVGGSAAANGIVGVALVDPFLDLGVDLHALGAVDVGLAVLGHDLHAVVLEQHFMIPVVPAAKHGAVALGGAVLVEQGGLFQEGFHLVDGLGHLDAFGLGGGLVVVHALGGDQIGQGDLLFVIAGGSQQALAEVLYVILEGVDVGVQDLAQASRAVRGGVGSVAAHQGGHGAGGVRGAEGGVDLGVAAHVLGLHGDAHAVFGIELIHHVLDLVVKLALVGMPPLDGDGLGDVVLGGGQRGHRAQQHDGAHQQGKQSFHCLFSLSYFRM